MALPSKGNGSQAGGSRRAMLIRGVASNWRADGTGRLAAGIQTRRSLNLPYGAVRCTATDVRKSRTGARAPRQSGAQTPDRDLTKHPRARPRVAQQVPGLSRCMGSECSGGDGSRVPVAGLTSRCRGTPQQALRQLEVPHTSASSSSTPICKGQFSSRSRAWLKLRQKSREEFVLSRTAGTIVRRWIALTRPVSDTRLRYVGASRRRYWAACL